MTITYNPSTNFGQKDALPVNDPDKVIYGAEFTTEFNAITTAFASAAPTNSPTFTGTITFAGDVSLDGSVEIGGESVSDTDVQGWNATKATVDAGATNWDTAYGWGDHGAAGYADGTNEANWDEAYSWGDHSLEGYTTTDTTYTAGAGLTLTGTVFSLNSTAISSNEVTALTSFKLGSRWEVLLSGLDIVFEYQGTPMMKLDYLGNFTVVGNVTAYGSL